MKLTTVICKYNRSALLLTNLEFIDNTAIEPLAGIAIFVIANA